MQVATCWSLCAYFCSVMLEIIRPTIALCGFLFLLLVDYQGLSARGHIVGGIENMDVAILLLLLLSFLIVIFQHRGYFRLSTPNNLIFMLFAAVWVFSLLRGIPLHGFTAFGEARWYLSSILIFSTAVLMNDLKAFKLILGFLFLLSVAMMVPIYFRLLGIDILPSYGAIQENATTGEVVKLAWHKETYVVMLGALLTLVSLIMGRRLPYRRVVTGIMILQLFVVVFAGVRTMYIILLADILFLMLIFPGKKLRRIFTFLLLTVLVGVMFMFFIPDAFKSPVLNAINMVMVHDYESSTAGWRLLHWAYTINEVFSAGTLTLLFGFPMGTDTIFLDGSGLVRTEGPHNDFVQLFHTTGLIGLGLFLWFLADFFRKALRFIRENARTEYGFLMAFITIVIFSQIIFSFFNTEIRHYGTGLLFWVFIGMGWKLRHLRQNTIKRSLDEHYWNTHRA